MQFWFIAMACGCLQVLQAMTNGAAARSGIGAIWVGAMSATVSALTLLLVALVIFRLPLPEADLLQAHGLKAVAGGMMGAFIWRASLSLRRDSAPLKRSSSIFSLSQPRRCSSTALVFWELKQSRWRLDSLSACCSRVSASPRPLVNRNCRSGRVQPRKPPRSRGCVKTSPRRLPLLIEQARFIDQIVVIAK